MPIPRSGLSASVLFIISACVLLSSCISKDDRSETLLKQYLQTADSLVMVGKGDSISKILLQQRSQFKGDNPQLSNYYTYMAEHNRVTDISAMGLYADSALMVFANKNNIEKFPDEYFKALLVKGDASMTIKQYETALEYYDKAKKMLSTSRCDDGNLDTKIAGIYFNQQNYHEAARYWVESYNKLSSCPQTNSAQKSFFLNQAALDNIGVSYQKAGMYDSAAYYYKKDLAFINRTDQLGIVDTTGIAPARVVVYDNLGGLYFKQGKLDSAEKFLTACINIPVKDVDGLRIPPFIKRAELYLQTGQYAKAAADFKQSRALLDRFGKDNPVPDIDWNRIYSQYLFSQKQSDRAYLYQAKYIRLKDSLDKTNSKIHRLDVDRELNAIHRENLLLELEHKERLDKLYIIGVSIAVVLLLAISMFINKVLRQSRKNHKNTRLQNEQLQQTLDELERANKNIIRIMRIMAHDLRNPLSGMIGLANTIIDDEASEENKHMLRLLEATGVHSLEMINELLKSGLADENETITKQSLDIKELLRDSVELLQFKANEKQQQIIFNCGDAPIITAINHEKIWRVFNNLIVNAIKFSHLRETIKVSIKADRETQRIVIAVADNGIGIPDKDKEKVFEMFTPAKRMGTDGEQPFGLGLSISKRIIENHNGKLWFESRPGLGTTFFIELPL